LRKEAGFQERTPLSDRPKKSRGKTEALIRRARQKWDSETKTETKLTTSLRTGKRCLDVGTQRRGEFYVKHFWGTSLGRNVKKEFTS